MWAVMAREASLKSVVGLALHHGDGTLVVHGHLL